MRHFLIPALLLASLGSRAVGAPWDELTQRSISRSRQFIVYSGDPSARGAIAMDAEDVKDKFLKLLGMDDTWKHPIVIDLRPEDTAEPNQLPSEVRIINTEDGFKVEFNIVLGDDPRAAHFPQQLMRAILLEFAYRNQPALVQAGVAYAEPPGWLVDGLANLTADQEDPEADVSLFRGLVATGKMPTLETFLAENRATLDGPSTRLYSACSMSLVKLLLDTPNGPALMQTFIRHLPGPNADPEAELLKAFPDLNSGSQSLEKWWAVGLASLSAADRYEGMSLEETNQELDEVLKLDVVMDKTGKKETFGLDQYATFKKAPGAAEALNNLSVRLLGLEAQGSPLLREVMGAYQTIAVELAHRDSRHVDTQVKALEDYRKKVLDHMDRIADYLNWYEATQRTQASGSFDEYIKTANDMDRDTQAVSGDPISKYMDSVEQTLGQ